MSFFRVSEFFWPMPEVPWEAWIDSKKIVKIAPTQSAFDVIGHDCALIYFLDQSTMYVKQTVQELIDLIGENKEMNLRKFIMLTSVESDGMPIWLDGDEVESIALECPPHTINLRTIVRMASGHRYFVEENIEDILRKIEKRYHYVD